MAWYECTGGNGSGPTPTPTFENYIYQIGNQGIGFNTGYIHKANTKIVFKAALDAWVGGYCQVFGARNGSYRANALTFFARFNSSCFTFCRTGIETRGATVENDDVSSPWNMQPCIFTIDGQTASWYRECDPSTVRSIITTGLVDGGIAPLAIFGCNSSNQANGWSFTDTAFGMILFWFEIYEGDTLVHRFVPAYNNDQYCLYDEVDQTYIYDVVRNGANVRGFVAS